VGIAAQLPSGPASAVDLDYASFWPFLMEGATSYEPLENILPEIAGYVPRTPGMPKQGSFLKNVTSFDNVAFGISVRDARIIPYSGRRLFDLTFRALLDAGIDYRGKKLGCFMSGNQTRPSELLNDFPPTGSPLMLNSMPNRVSYTFNLTGPSCFVDTACSSSVTALHLAVSAIERGDCSGAIVGSAQINRDFGRGEGAVVLVLKPLKDAIRDNDHVYSVIVGSAINATGSRMPLNVPSGMAQQGCIYAYSRACLDPKDADYIELHATGTAVGDPIEVNTAGPIFGKGALVGSVKGNIGYRLSGMMASLVKACLVLEKQMIPPTVVSSLTQAIDWDGMQVTVPVHLTALGCRSSQGRSTISLSASGLGGSTGHVVVHAPPAFNAAVVQNLPSPVLFLVGGLASNVVEQISHAASLLDTTPLGQHAVTLSRRARQMPWRTYFTLPLSPSTSIPSATRVPNEPPSLAFIFSGQGPQHFEMGRQLFAQYPIFRNSILELDDVYRRVKGVSLLESTGLFDISESLPTVTLPEFAWPAVITLAATAMLQIALFDLLKSIGIVPDVLLGHSAGETPVLYASGAGPKEMALEIAIARGECMASVESSAFGMATVACGPERASALITHTLAASADGVLEISCFNAPKSITVSGTSGLLDRVVDSARSEGLFAQRIRTMVPSHSSLLDKTKRDHFTRMNDIFARYPGSHTPCIPVFSTCQDQKFVESFSADYFWDNCRGAVRFSNAISHAIESSPVCLEISCHPVLSSSILAHGVADTRVLCPMHRSSTKPGAAAAKEPAVFLDTVGRLSLLGINSVDLSGLYGFSALKSKLTEHPLTARVIPPPKTWASHLNSTVSGSSRPLSSSSLRINTTTHPDLAEHVINGEPILPATGFIELLLEAGANFLWDVNFLSILSLTSSSPLEVGLHRMDSSWSITTTTVSLMLYCTLSD
ncbi:thiolase-like protein, partial [Mycena vitilis]